MPVAEKRWFVPQCAEHMRYRGFDVVIDKADILVVAPDGDLAYFSTMTGVRRWVRRKRRELAVAVVIAAALIFALPAAAARPPHYSLWMCVHKQERTAWNDPNPPYYGGLQMGAWFIGHYSHPAGTPDKWSPLTQMWVAENAYKHEHYSHSWLSGQWPPSRGVCF